MVLVAVTAMFLSAVPVKPGVLAQVGELAVPDLRWEWTGAFHGSRLVLSWPVPVALPPVHLHSAEPTSNPSPKDVGHLMPLLIAEPQVALGPRVDVRLLGAARAILILRSGYSALVEGLGVAGGDDRFGAGFGVGIGLGGFVSLVYRVIYAGSVWRQDLSLDFHIFSLPVSRYLDDIDRAASEPWDWPRPVRYPNRPCPSGPYPCPPAASPSPEQPNEQLDTVSAPGGRSTTMDPSPGASGLTPIPVPPDRTCP